MIISRAMCHCRPSGSSVPAFIGPTGSPKIPKDSGAETSTARFFLPMWWLIDCGQCVLPLHHPHPRCHELSLVPAGSKHHAKQICLHRCAKRNSHSRSRIPSLRPNCARCDWFIASTDAKRRSRGPIVLHCLRNNALHVVACSPQRRSLSDQQLLLAPLLENCSSFLSGNHCLSRNRWSRPKALGPEWHSKLVFTNHSSHGAWVAP